jgi:hypothetical protein
MSKMALVSAAIPAMLLCPLFGQTKWAGDEALAPRIGVFLDFDRDPADSSIQTMKSEVGRVLAATGAQLSWRMLKADAAPLTFDNLAVLRFRGNCRMGRIGTTVEPDEVRLTLGSTAVAAGVVTPFSSVECDKIVSCISGLLNSSCERDRDIALGRALGRVVAHELYHMLAQTREHGHAGLTKALQSPFDLIRENFSIDRQALQWLHEHLETKKNRARERESERGVPVVFSSVRTEL